VLCVWVYMNVTILRCIEVCVNAHVCDIFVSIREYMCIYIG